MMNPLLGWIPPINRTNEQIDAHAKAMANVMRAHALPPVLLGPNQKIMLTDAWKRPECVADIGFEFTGYHQLTGSCFPAGTPVRMADGSEKAIEDVQIGDEVVTHTGRCRRVTQTMRRNYTGEMFRFQVSGFPFPLEMTADHQVAIASKWREGEIDWKRADEVEEGDRVLLGWGRQKPAPQSIDTAALLGSNVIVLDELMKDEAFTKGNEPDVPNANFSSARSVVKQSGIDWHGKVRLHRSRACNAIFRHVPVCPSLARLVGLYLAEGGCHEGRVTFTLHAKETALAGEILSLVRGLFGATGNIVYQANRQNTLKVRFANQNLAEVLKSLVPGNVYTKRVPGLFFQADEETRLALLLGWMAGDGHVAVKGGKNPGNVRITGVTVCEGLARDMTTLALSCGLRATAGLRKPRGRSKVSYNVDLTGQKAVSLFPGVASRANGPRYGTEDKATHPHGYARKIRGVESHPVEMLPVFDFEVEEDHSFIACGLTVHNCVGASTGNWITTSSCVQRLLATDPTKAFACFWPFVYGRTRYNEGDRGQGEGAVDSVAGDTVTKEGYFDIGQSGLPTFDHSDGLALTTNLEYQWSDGASSLVTKWLPIAKQHTGAKAVCNNPDDIWNAIGNGYPVIDGCDYYVGGGHVFGMGDTAYVTGKYDGRGGHSTCYLGIWQHPTAGRLFLYSNQWAASTYPKDPAGAGRCCVWVPESEVQHAFDRYGMDGGETMALSHTSWFPAQPSVPDVFSWKDVV